jgi:hypothetical protein
MTLIGYSFDGSSKELEADFIKQRDAARIEFGTKYNSGTIAAVENLRVMDLRFAVFGSIKDAEQYTLANGSPNEMLAVRVSAPVISFDDTPEAEAARGRASVAALAYHEACEAIVERLRDSATEDGEPVMERCGACASSINVAVFRSRLFSVNDLRCPVCGESDFGLTPDDRATLAPLHEAVALARRELHAAESTFEETVERVDRWHVSGLVCL